jgi:hydrogenase maturation protein HypF
VYQLAVSRGLKGWVNNTVDGVHIRINATEKQAKEFLNELLDRPPQMAKITGHSMREVPVEDFKSFEIIRSASDKQANLLLTPDFAMCKDCERELFDPADRRYRYPFITCTNCGPRYSITVSLPYDRHTTTMAPFEMCPVCNEEYHDPLNRRYYSQTNSCPRCAVEMSLYENGHLQHHFTDLNYIVEQWHRGKIVAVKGIGGYLLTCDATNEETVRRLRKLKNRPVKPFALMYHDVLVLSEDAELDVVEKYELESTASPILLLPLREDVWTPLALDAIAPGLDSIGVMLPYTPLYKLLLDAFKKPIVATSGNISDSTIIYKDEQAIEELSKISDLILLNNREIVIPQDDSVVKYSRIKRQRIVIRRSRGLAPSYINPGLKLSRETVMAFGAMMKSTFTLQNNGTIHISQYLGSTDNLQAEENYKDTFNHFLHLFNPRIDVVLIDKHPGYFTHQFGKSYAAEKQIPLKEIQHHKAHFAAVLGENNLFERDEKILGVIWDGTGSGDDGNIWGGEFFEYKDGRIRRVGHMDAYPFILGDKMVREPRISALSIGRNLPGAEEILKAKFTETEWSIYRRLLSGGTKLQSTSIGRLFDAVASLLLDRDVQTYEGEAAVFLENAAYRYFNKNNFTLYYSYLKDAGMPEKLTEFILRSIIADINKAFDRDFIAAKFHITLAHYIYLFAKAHGYRKIAFSGGVFQNHLLTDLVLMLMDNDFDLYFHKELSPNDENVSFGQLMYHLYVTE